MSYFLVMIGGGIGAMLRFWVNNATARYLGLSFPFGTFAVNILGSLAIGLLIGLTASMHFEMQNYFRWLLVTGFLGGFTTFSAFSFETVMLFKQGEIAIAASYVICTFLLGVAMVWAGLAIAKWLG